MVDIQPNGLLRAVVRSLRRAGHAGRSFTVTIPGSLSESLTELESLVAAITRHDQLGAQAAMTRHISRTLNSAQIEIYPARVAVLPTPRSTVDALAGVAGLSREGGEQP